MVRATDDAWESRSNMHSGLQYCHLLSLLYTLALEPQLFKLVTLKDIQPDVCYKSVSAHGTLVHIVDCTEIISDSKRVEVIDVILRVHKTKISSPFF